MFYLYQLYRAGSICDPTTIQLLFKVSQALHDSIDYTSARDDDHQLPARLISQFVNMVKSGDLLKISCSVHQQVLSITQELIAFSSFFLG